MLSVSRCHSLVGSGGSAGGHRSGSQGRTDQAQQAATQPPQRGRTNPRDECLVHRFERTHGYIHRPPSARGEGDELGPSVDRVGFGPKVSQCHQVANELGHGLFGHAGTLGEFSGADPVVGDVGHDGVMNDAVVVEARSHEVLLKSARHVALSAGQEQEQRCVLVGVSHKEIVKQLDELAVARYIRQVT